MNILFLQGPNLNLLGVKSVTTRSKLTLDKLNRGVKKESKELDINLKILQTHKEFQAINFLQRNRNWANGLIFIPTSWARNNYTILETVLLIKIKTAVIYFEKDFSFGTTQENSIIKGRRLKSFEGSPVSICKEALDYMIKR